jgi:hypothetical protein
MDMNTQNLFNLQWTAQASPLVIFWIIKKYLVYEVTLSGRSTVINASGIATWQKILYISNLTIKSKCCKWIVNICAQITKLTDVYIMQIWIKSETNLERVFLIWGNLWTALLKGYQCRTNDRPFSKLAWQNSSAQTATQLVNKQTKVTLQLVHLTTVKLNFPVHHTWFISSQTGMHKL